MLLFVMQAGRKALRYISGVSICDYAMLPCNEAVTHVGTKYWGRMASYDCFPAATWPAFSEGR
jgi:hypothetical protein